MSAIPMLDDEEMYLAALLDDPSGIELAEFMFIDESSPDGCYRVWDFQWPLYLNDSTYQIDQCFPTGSLVLTGDGHVPIEQVRVGQRVLTHEGRWRSVTAVMDRGLRPTVAVKGNGHFGLRTTPEHELYVRRYMRRRKVELQAPQWRAASDLQADAEVHDKWASPAVVQSCPLPQIVSRYAPGRRNDLEPWHLDSDEFWWLVGLYLAEGSTSSSFGRGGKVNRVSFSVHVDEQARVEEVLRGLGFNQHPHRAGNVVNCVVHSYTLATFMRDIGGSGATGKRLHPSVLALPEKFALAVLRGALYGDGHYRNGSWSYTTVSRALAFDIKLLAQVCGWQSSVALGRPTGEGVIKGRRVQLRQQYYVSVCERPGRARGVRDGQHHWSRVTSVEAGSAQQCWDLEVEQDHSFVVEGVVVHNCARSIGKTQGILMRAFAFPFVYPGQEMLITAPELNHLRPITDKVENVFLSTRLGRELLPRTKGGGINHQPQFQARFVNGARIMSRLPNRDGRGVKGQHPLVIEMDEGQDYPEAGWTEIIETMKSGYEGCQWRVHGVSRGVRDTYYRMTQGENPDIPFYVHRYIASHRPTWSDKERRSKIAIYGGTEDNVDYRRNIFGEHGDTHNPVFVLARLMACVKINESAWATEYNEKIYHRIKINDELLRKTGMPIEGFLDGIPGTHLAEEYSTFWAGMDVGFTNDPSEILVFGATKKDLLRLLLRVQLQRISAVDQANVILEVFRQYGPRLRAFAMDKTGNGLPIWQETLRGGRLERHATRIKGYGFSEKRAVEFDDRPLERNEKPSDAVIERNLVDFATDELRKLVDTGRIELPYDLELLTEWQGQQVTVVKDMGSAGAVRRKYSDGGFHTLDAGRTMIMGKQLELIEGVLNAPRRQGPVLDQFFS